ncbi:MAG: DUF2905 domain-containing protein [Acidobacteriota bacterium]
MILIGSIIILFGLILLLFGKIPYLGKLPGDILIKKGNFTIYFPIVTCIIISLILTILIYLLRR